MMIWLRRVGVVALAAFVSVTATCIAINLVVRAPERIAAGFGSYVEVGASKVHYQRWGERGTPIVLVPGVLESSVAWSKVGPLLGRSHRVYALDLPGHGYTRYHGPMTLRGQADLVDGFIRALGLRSPTVVGHSMGAAVVGSVALRDPGAIGRVVFADGDGLPIGIGPRWTRRLILATPYATTAVRIGARWPWADRHGIRSTCGPRCPMPSTELADQWVRPLRQRADEQALHDLMVNADYGLTPKEISAIKLPASIIWGAHDHQGGSLRATIANLHHPPVHIIEGAGHLTMLADPQAFVRAVEG